VPDKYCWFALALGLPLTTPDTALAAYTKVRSATKISLEIERRGRPVTLHYRIKQ
jgi:hypothetical protein